MTGNWGAGSGRVTGGRGLLAPDERPWNAKRGSANGATSGAAMGGGPGGPPKVGRRGGR